LYLDGLTATLNNSSSDPKHAHAEKGDSDDASRQLFKHRRRKCDRDQNHRHQSEHPALTPDRRDAATEQNRCEQKGPDADRYQQAEQGLRGLDHPGLSMALANRTPRRSRRGPMTSQRPGPTGRGTAWNGESGGQIAGVSQTGYSRTSCGEPSFAEPSQTRSVPYCAFATS
jgi:hypothetical protein